jgi:hypothetical protein
MTKTSLFQSYDAGDLTMEGVFQLLKAVRLTESQRTYLRSVELRHYDDIWGVEAATINTIREYLDVPPRK